MTKYLSDDSELLIDDSWYHRPPQGVRGSAAGGVVVRIENGEVLVALIREGNWTRYVLPKGGIDPHEEIEVAARREIEEEAGFTELHLLGKLGVCERLSYEKAHWSVTHFLLFATTQIQAQPSDAANHPHTSSWFSIDQLPPMIWPEQQELIVSNRERIIESIKRHAEDV